MADERAVRAAEKTCSLLGQGLSDEVIEGIVSRRAEIIAAEYADVLAENERLKAEISEEGHDADSYFDKSRHQKARIAELEKQVAALRAVLVRVHYLEEYAYSCNEIHEVIEAAIGPIVYEKN